MIDITSNENLFELLILGLKHYLQLFFNKTILFLSILLSIIFTAIGYPKGILVFILTLVIIDTLTRHCAIVIQNYGKITLKNFLSACFTNKISSKYMKNGLGVKAFFYLIFLYMAHQASIHPEIIGRSYISNVLYSILFIIESKSITENLIDCGYQGFESILKFFTSKENELINKKMENK